MTSNADSGPNTLRAAVDAANLLHSTDTILFNLPAAQSTIDLRANDTLNPFAFGPTALVITSDITIEGGPPGVTLDGLGLHRVFAVASGASLTLESVTVTGGFVQAGRGGNVINGTGGAGGGAGGLGGAIFNAGSVQLISSTLTGNTAAGGNGGSSYGSGFVFGVAGGGGGVGGQGGDATGTQGNNGAGGGGGVGGPGGNTFDVNGPVGGANEVGGHAAFGTMVGATPILGQDGVQGGGGGGIIGDPFTVVGGSGLAASSGGFGGGGGGTVNPPSAFVAYGNGGFGGGGGGTLVSNPAGNGGFGGGGGGTIEVNQTGGVGGFGGGNGGGRLANAGPNSGGGGGAGFGGALFNNGGQVTITNSTLTGNTALGGLGGGAQAGGTAGSAGEGLGGAVFNRNGRVTILNSTLSANAAANGGRDVFNLGDGTGNTGFVSLGNSILGQADTTITDFASGTTAGGVVSSNGFNNLIRTNSGFPAVGIVSTGDPMLGSLLPNGGPTPTLALHAGSPAIGAGNAFAAPTSDQRGYTRIGAPDLGAFQLNANGAASVTATGTPQSAPVTTTFATALQATVADASNHPIAGVMVTFTAPATGASGTFTGGVTTIGALTNSSGVASVTFTANSLAGAYTVTAVAPGVATPATFSLTNLAGSAASISVTSGSPQSTTVATAFAQALVITVTDAQGNPLSGVSVTFTAPATGASGTFSNSTATITATTNGSGQVSESFAANTTPGAYTVTAIAPGVATSATFSLTNTIGGIVRLVAINGSGQSAQVATAFAQDFQVVAEDQFGNPASVGVPVTFTAPASGPGGTFAGGTTAVTVLTNANGVATAPTFTAGLAAGSYTVTATSPGLTTVSFSLSNTSPPGETADNLGAYRPGNGSWSLDSNGQFGFQTGGPEGQAPLSDRVILGFSPAGANVVPVSGDWAGLGKTEIGDFENGTWHLDLNDNGILDSGETFSFGTTGDVPVPGNYLPGGGIELAVFRSLPTGAGEFIISDSNWLAEAKAGQPIGVSSSFIFGAAGDHVVVGDWNGAGLTEVGVYRAATAFGAPGAAVFTLDIANHHAFDSSNKVFIFGSITDGVVIGDWNGSGTSKVGVYRDASAFGAPGTAVFSLDETGDFQFDAKSKVFLYGLSSDQYVTGHWAFTTSSGGAAAMPTGGADNAALASALSTAPGRNAPTALDAFFSQP